MKAPSELSTGIFSGPAEQKKAATRLKRLAGGLRSEVVATVHGLNEKETKALMAAIAVIDELAIHYGKAAAICRRRQEERDKAEKKIRALMAGNFVALASIEDKVTFIAAVHSYRLRVGQIVSVRDLDYYFQEDLSGFIYRMSGELKARTPEAAVSEAWEKFEEGRAALTLLHQSLIQKLERDTSSLK